MKTRILMLAGLLTLLTACGGGGDAASPPSGSGGGKASASPGAEKTPVPEPILLGTQRYASPCRLLDPDDLVRIYGDPGHYAYFTQTYKEKSVSSTEMASIGQTIGGSIDTECMYSFDDQAKTDVDITVAQYPSPAAALARWKNTLRLGSHVDSRQLAGQSDWAWLLQLAKENEASMGGVRVRGLDPTVLYVSGHTEFVGVRRNLLFTVSRKAYAGNFFAPKALKDTVRTTREVFRRLYQQADDQTLDQTAAPAYWQQTDGWPTFLDPCAMFDDAVMVGVTGHPTSKVESTSVTRDPSTRVERNTKPADKAVYNECERTAQQKLPKRTDFWHGSLQVMYGAPGDGGASLLDGVVLRRLFKTEAGAKYSIADLVKAGLLRRVEVAGADGAYEFHNDYKGMSFGWIVANTGPYVVAFDAGKSKQVVLGSVQMSEAARLAAVARIVANVKKAAADS